MTRKDRLARRKAMADAVAAGQSLESVASEYGVTSSTVIIACRECGVDYRKKTASPPIQSRWLETVHAALRGGMSASEAVGAADLVIAELKKR